MRASMRAAVSASTPGFFTTHAHLVQPDAQVAAVRILKAQVVQRPACVVARLAGGDEAEAVGGPVDHVWFRRFARNNARAAYHLVSKRRASCSRGGSGQRMCMPPRRHAEIFGQRDIHAVGVDDGSTSTLPDDSTMSWMVFMPTRTRSG